MWISTHTPVRVWQNKVISKRADNVISTHTPVRVWHYCAGTVSDVCWFQLTHPWGCDAYMKVNYNGTDIISTHTPVFFWNMKFSSCISTHTPVRVWRYCRRHSNNPCNISTHTPVRVWPFSWAPSHACISFQLTHPWGCDGIPTQTGIIAVEFQLTHPWGCDRFQHYFIPPRHISTHTPVRVWRKIVCYW